MEHGQSKWMGMDIWEDNGLGLFSVVSSSVRFSKHFPKFKRIQLTQNMRVGRAAEDFRHFLRRIGTGAETTNASGTGRITLPDNLRSGNTEELIEFCAPADALADPINSKLWVSNTELPINH